MIIWDLVTGRSLQTFKLTASQGITAGVWCPIYASQPVEAFAIADAVGRVTVYRKLGANYDYAGALDAFTDPVEGMAYDRRHRRLALVGDGCLKLFNLNAAYDLVLLHSTTPRQCTARSTGFYADGACVFICYLETQHITGYAISPWAVQFDTDLETRIGHATFVEGGDLYVSNLMDGIDVYSFPPNPVPNRNIRFYIKRNFPLTIAVAPLGGFAVLGGEDGHARLYNIHLGRLDGMLPHGNHYSLIQQVDLHISQQKSIVVTGSADDDNGSLKVWVSYETRDSDLALCERVNEQWLSWPVRLFLIALLIGFVALALQWLVALLIRVIPAVRADITGVLLAIGREMADFGTTCQMLIRSWRLGDLLRRWQAKVQQPWLR